MSERARCGVLVREIVGAPGSKLCLLSNAVAACERFSANHNPTVAHHLSER
jgi:hypothetical protein